MSEKPHHVMPKGKARVPALPIDGVKDKGTTSSAVAHASWTWGQGGYFPSNLIKTMTHCPRLAQTEIDYANAFIFDEDNWLNGVQQAGFVDRCTKEMLINAVAINNRCRYSLEHHSFIGMAAFQTADRLDEFLPKFLHLHEFEQYADNYSKLELALLRYTKKVCDDPHTVTDAEFQHLERLLAAHNLSNKTKRKGRLSDEANQTLVNSQIVEITWLVAHFCLLTRWFTALQVEAEDATNEANFLEAYRSTVPPEIIERNNELIGEGF